MTTTARTILVASPFVSAASALFIRICAPQIERLPRPRLAGSTNVAAALRHHATYAQRPVNLLLTC